MRPPRPIPAQESFQDIPFPSKGLDLRLAFSEQAEGTTPIGNNVRVFDPIQQRSRGGSRSGISKYVNSQLNGGQTPIQEINTVAYVNEQAIGSANFAVGGQDVTTLGFTGTYLLGAIDLAGNFVLSATLAVDADGGITVGTSTPGYPSGVDVPTLASAIQLPFPYFVVAYWQPGAFPLVQGDWQTGPVFPGFGYFANTFPGGFLLDFGYPAPGTTPGFDTLSAMPDLPFWFWPSGFFDIHLHFGFSISHALVVTYNVTVILENNTVQPDVNSFTGVQLGINGVTLDTSFMVNQHGSTSNFHVQGVAVYTDEKAAFSDGGSYIAKPWTQLFVLPPPAGQVTIFNTEGPNNVTVAINLDRAPSGGFTFQADNTFNQHNASISLQFGLIRLANFHGAGWKLGLIDQLTNSPFPPFQLGTLGPSLANQVLWQVLNDNSIFVIADAFQKNGTLVYGPV